MLWTDKLEVVVMRTERLMKSVSGWKSENHVPNLTCDIFHHLWWVRAVALVGQELIEHCNCKWLWHDAGSCLLFPPEPVTRSAAGFFVRGEPRACWCVPALRASASAARRRAGPAQCAPTPALGAIGVRSSAYL